MIKDINFVNIVYLLHLHISGVTTGRAEGTAVPGPKIVGTLET